MTHICGQGTPWPQMPPLKKQTRAIKVINSEE